VVEREESGHVCNMQWLVYYINKGCVVTSHGLGEIAGNCLAMGRIAKWTIELMGLDITYVPQMTIKS
jgi:hypothetical protein